jgi:homeobox-leucine zipper protein
MSAKDELIIMATTAAPLWISALNPNSFIHPEFLHEAEYKRIFTRGIDLKPFNFQTEASRYSATVPVSPITLVNILMDVDQWSTMFCSIISRARILNVLSTGIPGSYNETLQVMSAEFQVTSPYVPTRVTHFVRYCQQQSEGSWAIVDVSVDGLSSSIGMHSKSKCQKRPSGCLIQDLSNGCSQIIWVEHVDVLDLKIHYTHTPLVNSGLAFGARRWVAILERQVERFTHSATTTYLPSDYYVTPTVEGRRSLLQMANKIVISFCADIGNSTIHDWKVAEQTRCLGIKVSTNKTRDRPNKPPGLTRTAAASFQHSVSHNRLFDFLKDVHFRNQWDYQSLGKSVQEIVHLTTGHDPRNCVSLMQIHNLDNSYILQESFTDSIGSYVIYAPIDIKTVQKLLGGCDPDPIVFLTSGFSILPDMSTAEMTEGRPDNPAIGSLVTVATQISTELLQKKKGSVDLVCQLIQNTVERIQIVVI